MMKGITTNTVFLIVSHDTSSTWQHRLNIQNPVKIIQSLTATIPLASAARVGAAASLAGCIDYQYLLNAIREELSGHDSATPHAAKTSTSRGSAGYPGFKKNLFAFWVANKPAYVATVIASELLDLALKIETAKQIKGPRLIIALAPCPTGWNYEPKDSSDIGKLAVKTGVWPLKEYIDGKVIHTKTPKKRLPVEEYLNKQGRFGHLFKPQRNDELLNGIKQRVDDYWQAVDNG